MIIRARFAHCVLLIALLSVATIAFATASNVSTARAVPYISSYAFNETAAAYTSSVALDSAGNIYVGEALASGAVSAYVLKKDAVTGAVTTLAGGVAQAAVGSSPCTTPTDPTKVGPGSSITVGDGCPGTQAYLKGVSSIAVWKDKATNTEYVYILDAANFIHRVNLTTGVLEWVAGNGTAAWNGDGSTATQQLMGPSTAAGMAVDANGNVYFSDGGNNGPSIRMVTNNTTECQTAQGGPYTAPCLITVTNWTSSTTTKPTYLCSTSGYTDVSPAYRATNNGVWGIAFDGSGNLWLAENKCNAYRKLLPSSAGIVDQNSTFQTVILGSTTTTAQWIDTTLKGSAKFAARGVAAVAPGSNDMYLTTGTAIWLYDSSTGWVHQIVGTTATGCTSTTTNPNASAKYPSANIGCPAPYVLIYPNTAGGQMATDAAGNLYLADYNDYAVVKFATGNDFVGTAPQVKTSTPLTQYMLLHGESSLTGATATGAAFAATLTTSSPVIPGVTGTLPFGCTAVAPPSDGGTDCVVAATYTPSTSGLEKGTLTSTDNSSTPPAPLSLQLQGYGNIPVATNVSVKAAYQTPTTITLAASDSNNDSLTYSIVTPPASGSLDTINGNTVDYTPLPGFTGTDTFTYKANNGSADSNTATVTITVMPAAPVASDQSVTVSHDTATLIVLSATGTGTLTYTVVVQPANGTLTGTAPNLTYTPTSGYSGPDSFTFKATDSYGQDSSPATIALTVMSAGAPPVAASQTVTVVHNTATPITLSATGTGTLTYAVVSGPANGTLSGTAPNLIYTPTTDYVGSDSFTFKATDTYSQDSAPATVTINVLPAPPVATSLSVTVSFNAPTAITLTAQGTGSLTYAVLSQPIHGTLSGTAPNLTYTPTTDYVGSDSFTFKANNGADSAPATVTINVLPAAPVAASQSVTVYSVPTAITLNATGTGPLTYTVVAQPAHGTLSGTAPNLTYTPTSGYLGSDSFTFNATDSNNQASAPATVSITVLPVPPVAHAQSVTVSFNTATPVTLSATGAGTLTYTVLSQPTHGTLSGTAPSLTYTPTSGYSGADSFTFKANNGADSAPATVSITVTGVFAWTPASGGGSFSANVLAGNTASYYLQLSGWNGATGTVTFTCSGAPDGASCSVLPNTATLNGTAAIPVLVSTTTKGGSAAAASITPIDPSNNLPWGLLFAVTVLLAMLLVSKKNKLQWRLMGACATLVMVMALGACGGSKSQTVNSGTKTPAGSYTLTVTATAGTVTQSQQLTLTVQ